MTDQEAAPPRTLPDTRLRYGVVSSSTERGGLRYYLTATASCDVTTLRRQIVEGERWVWSGNPQPTEEDVERLKRRFIKKVVPYFDPAFAGAEWEAM